MTSVAFCLHTCLKCVTTLYNSENFTENEIIIDHVHESREKKITYFTNHETTFVHGSREIISFFHDSRQLEIGIHGSRKTPFPNLFSGILFKMAHQRKQSCCRCNREWHDHQPGWTKQQQ